MVALLVPYATSYSIVFAVAGWIGVCSAGVRGRPLVIGVLGFAGGGLTTAVLVAALLNLHLIGGSPLLAVMDYAIPMTLPWVIGGGVIGRALNHERHSNGGLRTSTSENQSR